MKLPQFRPDEEPYVAIATTLSLYFLAFLAILCGNSDLACILSLLGLMTTTSVASNLHRYVKRKNNEE